MFFIYLGRPTYLCGHANARPVLCRVMDAGKTQISGCVGIRSGIGDPNPNLGAIALHRY